MKATLIGPYVKSRAVVQDIRDAILQHKINPETSVIDKAYQWMPVLLLLALL